MAVDVARSKALHSGRYVERFERRPIDRVAALVRRMRVDANDVVADFACGNGMLLRALGDVRGTYHGVDFSEDFIASARAAALRLGLSNYCFHCSDIVAFCADHPAEFDVAATLDFSEHIDDSAFLEIYAAIRSSLRTGGRLYLHTPNSGFFMEALKAKGVLRQFPEHIAVRNAAATIALLEQAGFDRGRIRVEHIAHYNILRIVHPLRRLPYLGKFFAARIWIEASA